MNVVLDSLKTRRSIRGYDPDRMPAEELIGQIIEAGTYAPTGRGMQSPRIVVVTDRTVRDRLSALNAAHAVGLGSCWIHRAKEVFDSPEGKALLKAWGIEGDYEGIGHCILGYPLPGALPEAQPRKADYALWVR